MKKNVSFTEEVIRMIIFVLFWLLVLGIILTLFPDSLSHMRTEVNHNYVPTPLWAKLLIGFLMALCLFGLFRKNKKLRK